MILVENGDHKMTWEVARGYPPRMKLQGPGPFVDKKDSLATNAQRSVGWISDGQGKESVTDGEWILIDVSIPN